MKASRPLTALALSSLLAASAGIAHAKADDAPARAVQTQTQDRAVTNHCVESGQDKSDCLCLTLVLKHSLPYGDYRIVADRVTPKQELRFVPASIEDKVTERPTLDPALRTVMDRPDFAELCSQADRWFARSNARR